MMFKPSPQVPEVKTIAALKKAIAERRTFLAGLKQLTRKQNPRVRRLTSFNGHTIAVYKFVDKQGYAVRDLDKVYLCTSKRKVERTIEAIVELQKLLEIAAAHDNMRRV